jgi:AcrR family transcriptional regulator
MTVRKRMPSAERRDQIIDAVMTLAAESGLGGTTMARVAGVVGISEPALYRHFKNRREMLIEAFNRVSTELINTYLDNKYESVMETLIGTSRAFYNFVMTHQRESRVLFEFVCAPPGENLRDMVREQLLLIITMCQELLKRGQERGELRPDFDVELKAWELFAFGFNLNFTSMFGLGDIITEAKGMKITTEAFMALVKPQA